MTLLFLLTLLTKLLIVQQTQTPRTPAVERCGCLCFLMHQLFEHGRFGLHACPAPACLQHSNTVVTHSQSTQWLSSFSWGTQHPGFPKTIGNAAVRHQHHVPLVSEHLRWGQRQRGHMLVEFTLMGATLAVLAYRSFPSSWAHVVVSLQTYVFFRSLSLCVASGVEGQTQSVSCPVLPSHAGALQITGNSGETLQLLNRYGPVGWTRVIVC